MSQGFDELRALYRASMRKSPSLMMENNIQVDANRGVTSRGNSPYDKFASPETRAKVLEARLQEIDAFAQSRKIQPSAVYAAAEAAMRTGKVPDLGQFGMAGDDAVATKQFLISNVLNIAGLEWKDYKGDVVAETAQNPAESEQLSTGAEPVVEGSGGRANLERKLVSAQKGDNWSKAADALARFKQSFKSRPIGPNELLARKAKFGEINKGSEMTVPKRSDPRWGGFEQDVARSETRLKQLRQQQDAVEVNPMRFMSESSNQEGMRKGTQAHSGEWGRAKGGPDSGRIDVSKLGVGLTRSRREGRASAEAGLADYYADKASKQEEQRTLAIDPMRFMSEGSTKAEGYPFARKEAHYRGHTASELAYAHKDAVAAARAASGHDPRAEAWYMDDAATIAKEMNRRRKTSADEKHAMESRHDSSYLGEEGGPYRTGGAPESAPLSPTRLSDAGNAPANPQSYVRQDLLPKEIMSKLQQIMGDRVFGLTRAELFDIARERGMLGTEESAEGADLQEHDYRKEAERHGGKFVRYIQGNIGIYDFPSEAAATKFAGSYASKTTATPRVDGKRVFIDEPVMGESGYTNFPPDSDRSSTRTADRLADLSRNKVEDEAVEDSVDAEIRRHTTPRSVSDSILGIEPGDPRGETWPKLSPSMRELLNLESTDASASPVDLSEASTASGMGGFIGAGLKGVLSMRPNPVPSYNASYELPEDPEERVKFLKRMLSKHGLASPDDAKQGEK